MKFSLALSLLFIFAVYESLAIKNYIGTELQKCLNCLCHARTGCFSRFNCASYSISFDYWKTASSPVLSPYDDPDAESSYRKCMNNENCILATLSGYADAIGHMDCNCDGVFDCKDRLAIHLNGHNCRNPVYTQIKASRYNTCIKDLGWTSMSSSEGYIGCEPMIRPE